MKALGAEGMIKDLLKKAEDLFYRNNSYVGTPIYNSVLHSLVDANEVSACSTCPLALSLTVEPTQLALILFNLAFGTNNLNNFMCRQTRRLKYLRI